MRPDDHMLSTYRGHVDVIARRASLDGLLAEVFGRATGVSGGKGGSMHLMSVDHEHYGSYAIIGAQLPIACGLGWSARLRKTDQTTVCCFGNGATNIGAFHEALNLAVVWKLPVVFVCNNNLYMEYTRSSEVTAVPRPAADRAGAYGLEPVMVDGNDVEAVFGVARAALARARSGGGSLPGRGPDLPALRPLRGGPRHLSLQGGGGGVEGQGSHPQVPQGPGGAGGLAHRAGADRGRGRSRGRRGRRTGPLGSPARRLDRVDRRLERRRVGMAELTYRNAVHLALAQEMERDERVVLIGEDLRQGGVFKTSKGLFEQFGPDRVWDTPWRRRAT
jgi:hypothetical protein